jgi:hypothetical protein
MELTSTRFTSSGHLAPERTPQPVVHTIATYHPSELVYDFDTKPAPSYYDTNHSTAHLISLPTPSTKQSQRSLFKRIFGPRDTKRHQSNITIDTTVAGSRINRHHISELSASESPLSELHGGSVCELHSPGPVSPGSSAISPTPRHNKVFYNDLG